jgi:hypothetical protein
MPTNNPDGLFAAVDALLEDCTAERFDPTFLESSARSIEVGKNPEISDPGMRRAVAAELRRRAAALVDSS